MHLILQLRIAGVYRIDGRVNIYVVNIALLELEYLCIHILDELIIHTRQLRNITMIIIKA